MPPESDWKVTADLSGMQAYEVGGILQDFSLKHGVLEYREYQ